MHICVLVAVSSLTIKYAIISVHCQIMSIAAVTILNKPVAILSKIKALLSQHMKRMLSVITTVYLEQHLYAEKVQNWVMVSMDTDHYYYCARVAILSSTKTCQERSHRGRVPLFGSMSK